MDDNTLILILDPVEVDTLRGWLGFILDSPSIDNQSRTVIEGIYNALEEKE